MSSIARLDARTIATRRGVLYAKRRGSSGGGTRAVFWFLIAAVAGVLTYLAFRRLGNLTARLSALAAIIIVAAIAAFCLRHWLSHAEIGQVEALRLLLGFLIGLAGGYFFVNVGITVSANVVLWTALGVFVIALVAPHFDRWATRLSSFKASGLEVQLATISNAVKAVQPDSREQFLDEQILVSLGDFDEIIKRDIAYIEHFRIPNLEELAKQNPNGISLKDGIRAAKDQLGKLKELQTVFNQIVSPLTRCVVSAIENGYHIESARSELRPVADQLTRIITLEDRKLSSSPPEDMTKILDAARWKFWSDLRTMPDKFAPYADPERASACLAVTTATIPDPTRRHQYFSDLPHLFVSRAFLLLFVGNDELALRELQKARHSWKMDDLYSGYLMGRVSYYRGEPIDQYVETLEKMKTVAKDRQEVIRKVTAACGAKCSVDVQQWEPMLIAGLRRAEHVALNFIAYGIAQDLAQELKQAEPLRPIAEDYASQLKKYVESAAALDEVERDSMLDTAAFVTIVSQAARKERDQKVLKDAVDTLAALVARAEQRAAKETGTKKTVRLALKEMRAHFASGKSLLED
jgi:hypothetical protein